MSWRHRKLKRHRWERVRQYVFERDHFRCTSCGKAGRLECDHINPLEREPGQDPYDPNGLQALCRSCHVEKTARENRKPLSAERRAWRDYLKQVQQSV